MIPMNAAVADDLATKAAPRPRSTKKLGDHAAKGAPTSVAKSRDARKTKVSLYLDTPVAEKLAVSAIIRHVDQSDIANQILGRALSSVSYYDRGTAKPQCDNEEVGEAGAAA